jgi:hypothetical protein
VLVVGDAVAGAEARAIAPRELGDIDTRVDGVDGRSTATKEGPESTSMTP